MNHLIGHNGEIMGQIGTISEHGRLLQLLNLSLKADENFVERNIKMLTNYKNSIQTVIRRNF